MTNQGPIKLELDEPALQIAQLFAGLSEVLDRLDNLVSRLNILEERANAQSRVISRQQKDYDRLTGLDMVVKALQVEQKHLKERVMLYLVPEGGMVGDRL